MITVTFGSIDTTLSQGKWSCKDRKFQALLQQYQTLFEQTLVSGQAPHQDYFFAGKMAEEFNGRITKVELPEPAELTPGLVY